MLVKAGGFSASLDYWSFDFENQIVNEPVAGITNFVFGTGAAASAAWRIRWPAASPSARQQ